jgi:hypothetical protein
MLGFSPLSAAPLADSGTPAFNGTLSASYTPVADLSGGHGVGAAIDASYAPLADAVAAHGVAAEIDAFYVASASMEGVSDSSFSGPIESSYSPVADLTAAHGVAASVTATYLPTSDLNGVRGVSGTLPPSYSPVADIVATWSPEPTFTIALPVEITLDANDYTISLPVALTVESPAYTIALPVAITVEENTYTISLPVEITVDAPAYTLSLPVEIDVFTPGNLDGDWLPQVFVDGVEVDYDNLTGQLQIVRQRGVTATLELTYVLEAAIAATFKVTHFRKKPVIVNAISGASTRREFTGKVQTALWDKDQGLVTLFCTDTLEDQLINISHEDVAGFVSSASWSDVVFGERPERARDYLDQLIEVEPVSLQCDVYDILTPTPLAPAGTFATLDSDDVVEKSQSIREVDDKQIINRFEVTLTSRGAACYGKLEHLNYRMGQSLPPIYGPTPAWLYSISLGGRLMERGMIQQAIESTGWHLEGEINYVPPPASATYNLPNINDPGALSDTGMSVFFLKPPSLVDQFAIEFTANLRREWGQTVEVVDKIVVEWQASINTYGLLTEKESYLSDTDFDVQAWETSKDPSSPGITEDAELGYAGWYRNGEEEPASGVALNGSGLGMEPHVAHGITVIIGKNGLGWGSSQLAVDCIVKRCQNESYKTHLGSYDVDLMRIAPDAQIGDGFALGAGLLLASESAMPVERITHTWDFDGNAFYTSLSLGYIPVGDPATESGSTPATFTAPTFGTGYLDQSPHSNTNPVVYFGETEEGETKMEITLAAIDDAYRETETLDRTATPLTHGVWCASNNLTITAIERA